MKATTALIVARPLRFSSPAGLPLGLIGSFTDIRGGHVYPDLVRKADRQPIRIFIQDGVHDNRNPRTPARDWHLQNQAMVAALREKDQRPHMWLETRSFAITPLQVRQE